jgi:hypothetical protein
VWKIATIGIEEMSIGMPMRGQSILLNSTTIAMLTAKIFLFLQFFFRAVFNGGNKRSAAGLKAAPAGGSDGQDFIDPF